MIEYCETLNQASMKSKVINIDTATDFFSFISVSYEQDGQYNKELNKSREILEDSLNDNPEMQYVSNYMGALDSSQIDNYDMWYIKIIRGDALKKLHEDKVNNSTPETMIQEIRSRLVPRGAKAFSTLISQFQCVDEFFSKDIDREKFIIALGYF